MCQLFAVPFYISQLSTYYPHRMTSGPSAVAVRHTRLRERA